MKKSFLFVIFTLLIAGNAQAEISIIVNPANSNALGNKEIKRIFLGKLKSFPTGEQILPIALVESAAGQGEFLKKVLKKTPAQFKSYWATKIFTGKGVPPKEFPKSKDIIDIVKDNPNTIGFILTSDLTSDVKEIAKY